MEIVRPLLFLAFVVLLHPSARAAAPPLPERAPPIFPQLERHQVLMQCQSPTLAGGSPVLSCDVRIELTLSEMVPALFKQGLNVKIMYQDYTLQPIEASPDGGHLVYEVRGVERPATAFTAAVTDVSSAEARHPLLVDEWMADFYALSYTAQLLYGVPLELTLDFPAELRPESTWWHLAADTLDNGRSVLHETFEQPHFYIGLEEGARFTSGGPLVGVGCYAKVSQDAFRRENRDFEGCPLATVGWEVSYPDWLFFQMRLETDFQRELSFVPAVEATLFLDHWGVGLMVGLPIEVMPTPRAGVRVGVTFFTWVVRAGIGVDIQPLPSSNVYTPFSSVFNAELSF